MSSEQPSTSKESFDDFYTEVSNRLEAEQIYRKKSAPLFYVQCRCLCKKSQKDRHKLTLCDHN